MLGTRRTDLAALLLDDMAGREGAETKYQQRHVKDFILAVRTRLQQTETQTALKEWYSTLVGTRQRS